MDLNRLPNDQKLSVCKFYFRVGWFLVPFAWAVNAVWFYKEAFRKPPYDEQKQIKKYVIMSGIGSLVWLVLFSSWVVYFQLSRVSWGSWGDDLSFVLPVGRA